MVSQSKIRKQLRDKLRRFPEIKRVRFLDKLEDLPSGLRETYQKLVNRNIKIRESFNELPRKELAMIPDLRAQGFSYKEIEAILRLKPMNGTNAYRAEKKLGKDPEMVLALRKKGFSYREIERAMCLKPMNGMNAYRTEKRLKNKK